MTKLQGSVLVALGLATAIAGGCCPEMPISALPVAVKGASPSPSPSGSPAPGNQKSSPKPSASPSAAPTAGP